MLVCIVESKLKSGFAVEVLSVEAEKVDHKYEVHVKHPTGFTKVTSTHNNLGDALANHYKQVVHHCR